MKNPYHLHQKMRKWSMSMHGKGIVSGKREVNNMVYTMHGIYEAC